MGGADFHDGADDGIDFRDALADCQIAPYARMALRIGTIKCNDRCEVGARRVDTGVWHKRSGFEPVEPPWGYAFSLRHPQRLERQMPPNVFQFRSRQTIG